MALIVTHATVASDPQAPLLGASEWNDTHVVDLLRSGLHVYERTGVYARGYTFMEHSSTLANYQLSNLASGTSAATTVSTNTTVFGSYYLLGILRSVTGTTAAGHAGAYLTPANYSGAISDGVNFYAGCFGLIATTAPTIAEDFDTIVCWFNNSTTAAQDETSTTLPGAYFLGSRAYANWQLSYVDDANVRTLIDTGVTYVATTPTDFEILIEWGATAADHVVTGWINGVQVAQATGMRANSGVPRFWPMRIEKLAGLTSRDINLDALVWGVYDETRYT